LLAADLFFFMKSHLKVHFKQADANSREVLMALLSGIGFEGFEETHQHLIAYAEEGIVDLEQLQAIADMQQLSFETTLLPAQNWNESWEKNFHPVVVDQFCAIRADFHEAVPDVQHEIIITPKMSFGTGHHATTFMMLQGMAQTEFNGKTVLDFGTGTGVLAIMALKLGAEFVRAIDNDDWSIENARENFERNHFPELLPEKAENLEDDQRQYDIILANINKNVLLHHMESISNRLKPGGLVWMSGLLQGDVDAILRTAEAARLSIIGSPFYLNGWSCIQLKK